MRQFISFLLVLFLLPSTVFAQEQEEHYRREHRPDDGRQYTCWSTSKANLQGERLVSIMAVGEVIAVNQCRFASSVRYVYISAGYARDKVNLTLFSAPQRVRQSNYGRRTLIQDQYQLRFGEELVVSASRGQRLRIIVTDFYEGRFEVEMELVYN